MASNVKYPIRLKLLLLLSGAVLTATAAYLALATKLFRDDKTTLVYELNASAVKTLSAELDASLQKISDKVNLLTRGHVDPDWARAVFEAEPDLISYTLYRALQGEATGSDWKPVIHVRNSEYLKLYGLDASAVEQIHQKVPIPFAEAYSKRSLAWNSTLRGGAPIVTLALALDIADGGGPPVPHLAVVDLRLDSILKLVSQPGIATVYVVDAGGRTVAARDSDLVSSHAPMGDVPIVRDLASSPVKMTIKRFDWRGESWIGATDAVGIGGLTVVSQVRESEAFRAARRLVSKSLLFALIVVTVSILLANWLARSFTEPLQRLLEATERLARWQFGESVHVKTHDEIAALARSFNSMAGDIQNQRNQLEAHSAELEVKVRERTKALEDQKRQVIEAQDALIRTTRLASLGELAGAAAHEVLNPVNNMNIRVERSKGLLQQQKEDLELLREIADAWKKAYDEGGWSKLQQELGKPAELQTAEKKETLLEEDLKNISGIAQDSARQATDRLEDCEFLSKEIFRITRIVNNMRSLSRVGGTRTPIDVHAPLDDTFATLSDLFEKKKVALVREYSADPRELFSVVADKDELVQVFTNLLRNGLHAVVSAHRRAGEIRIKTSRSGDRVEVRIIDNGTGIRPEHVGKIFEPDFTTKSLEEGTGLGLSISRRLVRAFSGDIEVEASREGEGTTFLIWFPAAGANSGAS